MVSSMCNSSNLLTANLLQFEFVTYYAFYGALCITLMTSVMVPPAPPFCRHFSRNTDVDISAVPTIAIM